MSETMGKTVFQRLWYTLTVLCVIGLALTGFEIHGSYRLLGFRAATLTHDVLTVLVIGLGILYVFWAMVTGTRLGSTMGEGLRRRINVLLVVVIWVVMAVSGLLYIGFVIFHDAFAANLNREAVALTHTAGAFLVLAIGIWQLYLSFTVRD